MKSIRLSDKKRQQKRSEFKSEVNDILHAVNTTKQLVEAWPEIEQFIPAYLVDPSKAINLPAIPTSRLNEKLGIK